MPHGWTYLLRPGIPALPLFLGFAAAATYLGSVDSLGLAGEGGNCYQMFGISIAHANGSIHTLIQLHADLSYLLQA